MSKKNSLFVCQNCGSTQSKWSGQCPSCSEWNTFVETVSAPTSPGASRGARASLPASDVVTFGQVQHTSGPAPRISTGIGEFDRVLGADRGGAGMVPGAVMLIGGEPGIGKSTLLTQMVVAMAKPSTTSEQVLESSSGVGGKKRGEARAQSPIVYVAGEESPEQISLRINRIIESEHIKISPDELKTRLVFLKSTNIDQVLSYIEEHKPYCVIIDSIQTMTTTDLVGGSGSIGQLRECTERITSVAKAFAIPTFLVGHVTKEGSIAGPKVLEHVVDAVLELSGERTGQLRILRALKNRFGATDEVGVFQVSEFGLTEVSNPSQLFLEQMEKQLPGAATVCVMEGTRPLLVEVQALVLESQLAMPRRVGRGVQLSRVQVLAAVLQKHCGVPLGNADIFLNVAGGFTITEPAVDLGLALAMVSSFRNMPLPPKTIFIGEVGLLGEVRRVNYLERRIKEAKRLGFTTVISQTSHRYVTDVIRALKLA